jgi:hypothetical protein
MESPNKSPVPDFLPETLGISINTIRLTIIKTEDSDSDEYEWVYPA